MARGRYIGGELIQGALIAGAHALVEQKVYLNSINVFPVADQDTGTNLAETVQAVREALHKRRYLSISCALEDAGEAALENSRGNSGIIFSQFLLGCARALKKVRFATANDIATSLEQGVYAARQAVTQPAEGTILSVLADWAQYWQSQSRHYNDIISIARHSVAEARESLGRTPRQMKLLRKNKVVDAGAQAFVFFLEGAVYRQQRARTKKEPRKLRVANRRPEQLVFRYCTEAVVHGHRLDSKSLRAQLAQHGDSLVVAAGERRARVHIHTNTPKRVFTILEDYGELSSRKADDMQKQKEQHAGRVGVVVDSTCDLSSDYLNAHGIELVPIEIRFGEQAYQEKRDISSDEVYGQMSRTSIFPKTSQPAVGQFREAFAGALERHSIIYVFVLSSHLSGTYQAARAAANEFGEKVRLIDTWSVSFGIGLIVQAFLQYAQSIDEKFESNFDDALKQLDAYAANLVHASRYYLTVPSLDNFIRGGRLSGTAAVIAQALRLKPLISRKENGETAIIAKAFTQRGLDKKLWQALRKETKNRIGRFAVAHFGNPELASYYASAIEHEFGGTDIEVGVGAPVTGIYAGPGAVAIFHLRQ